METQVELSELEGRFRAWRDLEVTKLFFQRLSKHRHELMESWANGDFLASFDAEALAKNAGAVGACSMIDEISNYKAEDLLEL